MTNETETRPDTEWKTPSGTLPPLLIPVVDKPIEGVLEKIDRDEEDDRTFYRMRLTAKAEGWNTDKEDVSHEAGELVSVPGSGGLDWRIKSIKEEIGESLEGHPIRIKRLEDDKMKKGKFKGKPVKVFDVKYK